MSAIDEANVSLADFFARAIEGLEPAPWCENLTYQAMRHAERNCEFDCNVHAGNDESCHLFGRGDGTAIAQIRNRADEILAALRRDDPLPKLWVVVIRNDEIVEDCEVFTDFEEACAFSDRFPNDAALVYPKTLDFRAGAK